MFLLVSSIMSILSFVYCLDYANIFCALSYKHFEYNLLPTQSVPLPKMFYCSLTKRNSVLFLPISIQFIFLPSYLLTSKGPRWPSGYTRSLTDRSQA